MNWALKILSPPPPLPHTHSVTACLYTRIKMSALTFWNATNINYLNTCPSYCDPVTYFSIFDPVSSLINDSCNLEILSNNQTLKRKQYLCKRPSPPPWLISPSFLTFIVDPETSRGICQSFSSWDIMFTRFSPFDPCWPQMTLDPKMTHQKQ